MLELFGRRFFKQNFDIRERKSEFQTSRTEIRGWTARIAKALLLLSFLPGSEPIWAVT
jgi:hypothetical protein